MKGGIDRLQVFFRFGAQGGICPKAIRMPDLDQVAIGLADFVGCGGGLQPKDLQCVLCRQTVLSACVVCGQAP